MAATTELRGVERAPEVGSWTGPVVDVDAHVMLHSAATLFPYIESGWEEWLGRSAFPPPPVLSAQMYPPNAPTTVRPDWRPEDGTPPASSLELLRSQLLDKSAAETTIVNANWGIEGVRQPEVAAVLASATNDWLIEEFLAKDERLRASIIIPHHDPAAAIREIERVGDHPGFVQVFLPVWSQMLWGKRLWQPLFKAIAAKDLVAGIHYGGTPDSVPTATGWPPYFVEHYAAAPAMFFTQLVNIVGEGLLEAVPDLRLSFLEGGFTWMPGALWRMNKEWKGLRRDVPWLKRLPAESIRERVKVSIQPLDSDSSEDLAQVLEWLGSDQMLMYASDYPHEHADHVSTLLAGISDADAAKVMFENAKEQYRL